MKSIVAVYLFEGYSDWEVSYVLPELKKLEQFDVVFVTETGDRVTSMGGLTVLPTVKYADLDKKNLALLIVPGGTMWETDQVEKLAIYKEIYSLNKQGVIVAAICGATVLLAQTGVLNNMMHTSNDLNYLKACAPSYNSEDLYLEEYCVTDGTVITANGISPIEFARDILSILKVDSKYLEQWYKLFKHGIWTEA
ncbi:MAG: DJ-1/PfpI family protein [Flavobacteriaceae bacterium]|jgi:putative intracellular protease/amidase|nr:DJ-1/PfpI family protein [Flavobacteriaceae bacterium]